MAVGGRSITASNPYNPDSVRGMNDTVEKLDDARVTDVMRLTRSVAAFRLDARSCCWG